MAKLIGGYHSLRTQSLTTRSINKHTAALDRPVGGLALDAINHVQRSAWRINPRVLEVAKEAREAGIALAGLPLPDDIPLPPRLSDDQWAAMDQKARTKHLRDLEALRNENVSMAGIRAQTYRRIDRAESLAAHDRFFFPHCFDFRGRVYPIPQDLNPQGDSLAKGLLTFSRKSALGKDGWYWLCVGFANTMGNDKISLDQRVAWTEQNLGTILAVADNPVGMMDWWGSSDVDSPWEALASAFEIAEAARWVGLGNRVEEFESSLPVRLDATCSGIQHLSALMRDRLAAQCVNVLPTGKREDIYSDVARVAAETVSRDAMNGVEFADLWVGHIKRKTVKRAVMTTPYGVTARGIADQLIADGFADHIDRSVRAKAANYLRDVVVGALDANIGAPRRAMAYFQEVARHLGDRDLPMQWTTPAGFTVRQAYHPQAQAQVKTLLGGVTLRVSKTYNEAPDAGVDVKKQALASAPNVVHSFDAAHLCRTAVAMRLEGVEDLAFVHDSFGAHAGNIAALNKHTREQFVAMYGGDTPLLHLWRESVAAHTGCDDIPEPPPLGDLDVSAVLESPFFFS